MVVLPCGKEEARPSRAIEDAEMKNEDWVVGWVSDGEGRLRGYGVTKSRTYLGYLLVHLHHGTQEERMQLIGGLDDGLADVSRVLGQMQDRGRGLVERRGRQAVGVQVVVEDGGVLLDESCELGDAGWGRHR